MSDLPCLSWSPQSELGHTPGGFEVQLVLFTPPLPTHILQGVLVFVTILVS